MGRMSEANAFLGLGPAPLVCRGAGELAAVSHLHFRDAGRIWLQSRDAFLLSTASNPQAIHQTLPKRSVSSQLNNGARGDGGEGEKKRGKEKERGRGRKAAFGQVEQMRSCL